MPVIHTDAPHHRYFRAKEGHWKGHVRMEITDLGRLRKSALRLLDRWSMWSMAFASSRLSTLVLATSMDCTNLGDQNQVLHTTRMSNLGVTLFRSRETILLNEDGRSFRMKGEQAYFPLLWKMRPWVAHGEVAADHDGAVYYIPLFGEILEQRTRMTAEGLEVIQTTPFSLATILLRRKRSQS